MKKQIILNCNKRRQLVKGRIISDNFRIDRKTWIYLIILIFLTLISVQEWVLEQLESDLGAHMIIEHAIYFARGSISLIVAERVLKMATVHVLQKSNKRGQELPATT